MRQMFVTSWLKYVISLDSQIVAALEQWQSKNCTTLVLTQKRQANVYKQESGKDTINGTNVTLDSLNNGNSQIGATLEQLHQY